MIEPKSKEFVLKNSHGAIIATMGIYNGAFGKYINFNQKISDISAEQLEEALIFMKKFEINNRF